MGLDMYLYRKTYVGLRDRSSVVIEGIPGVDPEKIRYVVEEAIYWRKSNMIHNWFVEHVQGGIDDCGSYPVSYDELHNLYATIVKVLKPKKKSARIKKAQELLPPLGGPFFGGTEIEYWYWKDLEQTQDELKELLVRDFQKDSYVSYEYYSSW